jgi:integrase
MTPARCKAKRPIRARLIDCDGQGKYLTPSEREAFLKAAEDAGRETRTFCHVLAFTGCRISEASIPH